VQRSLPGCQTADMTYLQSGTGSAHITMAATPSPAEIRSIVEHDPRWAAIVTRDRRADATFFYSVKTTGIYCRPWCGARRPNPANVQFHETAAGAERAGFRPCRRCHPDRSPEDREHVARVAHACRALESGDETPSLATLARHAGLSPHHFHRVFKAATGVTPREYAAAHRAKRVRQALGRDGASITDAIYAAGFNSSGRFYEAAADTIGMTPSAYRSGGLQAEIRFAVAQCSLGSILVARSEKGICAILLGDDPDALVRDLQDTFPKAALIGGDRAFEQMVARVIGFVEKPDAGLDLPLDIRGTAFQQRVWQALRRVPAGKTVSYAELARRIGAASSIRAVARACAANTIAIAIPCHRVVRTDGSLSGYRWGVDRKRRLLQREGGS